jgi:hypothetical protein
MWRLVGRGSAATTTATLRQAGGRATRVLGGAEFQRRLISKVYNSSAEAVHDVSDGSTMSVLPPSILLTLQCSICGGFGICGVAENLLRCVGEKGVKYAPLAQYLSLPSELS